MDTGVYYRDNPVVEIKRGWVAVCNVEVRIPRRTRVPLCIAEAVEIAPLLSALGGTAGRSGSRLSGLCEFINRLVGIRLHPVLPVCYLPHRLSECPTGSPGEAGQTRRRTTTVRLGKEADVSGERTQGKGLEVQIRWLIRRDMADVLRIEQSCFDQAWTEEEFLCCLRQRNCIGMVAEADHEILGFMIYELHKAKLRILNFAVSSSAQRQGVGTCMVQRLIDKLSQQRRKEILLDVRETNLAAQMFYKKQGFRAVHVLREHYDDTTEDAYVMIYRMTQSEDGVSPFSPNNRISEFDAA